MTDTHQTSKYSVAIKNQDITQILSIFNTELATFLKKESTLYKEWFTLKDATTTHSKHLKWKYDETWIEFVENIPFQLLEKYDGDDGPLSLTDIITLEPLGVPDEQFCSDLIEQIVRYTVYLHIKHNRFFKEFIIWQCLNLVEGQLDVTSMTITPDMVVSKVYQIMKEVESGKFQSPQATLFNGKLYHKKLSSSAKGFILREEKVRQWLEEYIIIYKERYHILPSKPQVRDYLVSCCLQSADPHLKIFQSGMNIKTFRKYTSHLHLPRTKRRK